MEATQGLDHQVAARPVLWSSFRPFPSSSPLVQMLLSGHSHRANEGISAVRKLSL